MDITAKHVIEDFYTEHETQSYLSPFGYHDRLVNIILTGVCGCIDAEAEFSNMHHNAGTFWGELAFFKLERGVNSLQIESGDCWYAEPEYKIEEEVREGELGGSMYGLVHRNHSTPKTSLA